MLIEGIDTMRSNFENSADNRNIGNNGNDEMAENQRIIRNNNLAENKENNQNNQISRKIIDDYDIIADFGKYKGKRIMEIPNDYREWLIKNKKDHYLAKACIRIKNRRAVTNLIKKINYLQEFPRLSETNLKIQPIFRDTSLNPRLFGSFVEYSVKFSSGYFDDKEVLQLFKNFDPNLTSNELINLIYKSYLKKDKTISDICKISIAHSILMDDNLEIESKKLIKYVEDNQDYFEKYFANFKIKNIIPEDQKICDKICVGVINGVMDLILDKSIVDIKCCISDDLDYYQKQLFTYACLYYLRYGKEIEKCQIYNFLTGKHYEMILNDSCKKYAKIYIKNLGSFCPEHAELF